MIKLRDEDLKMVSIWVEKMTSELVSNELTNIQVYNIIFKLFTRIVGSLIINSIIDINDDAKEIDENPKEYVTRETFSMFKKFSMEIIEMRSRIFSGVSKHFADEFVEKLHKNGRSYYS